MIKTKIQFECEKNPTEEVCGFIVLEDDELKVMPTENKSTNPSKHFYIPAKEFLYIKTKHNLVGIYHSHCIGSEKPSDFDKSTAELTCYPFVIYSLETNMFGLYKPENCDVEFELVKKLKEELA